MTHASTTLYPATIDSDEWLADYRAKLQETIRKRTIEGDPEWLDRVAVILEK
jgi:hypothetical protein